MMLRVIPARCSKAFGAPCGSARIHGIVLHGELPSDCTYGCLNQRIEAGNCTENDGEIEIDATFHKRSCDNPAGEMWPG
jgi:hypothetical protein